MDHGRVASKAFKIKCNGVRAIIVKSVAVYCLSINFEHVEKRIIVYQVDWTLTGALASPVVIIAYKA